MANYRLVKYKGKNTIFRIDGELTDNISIAKELDRLTEELVKIRNEKNFYKELEQSVQHNINELYMLLKSFKKNKEREKDG